MNIKFSILFSCLGLLASPAFAYELLPRSSGLQVIVPTTAPFKLAGRIRPGQNSRNGNATRVARKRNADSAHGLRSLALQLVNRDRQSKGLPSLTPNELLSQVAQKHAEDMIRKNYFSHTSLDGKSPTQRVRGAGGSITAGENIINYQSGTYVPNNTKLVAQLQDEFMNSPGHRKNILKSGYSDFGFGIASTPGSRRIVVVQLFGLSSD